MLQDEYRDGIRKDKNEHAARQHLPEQRKCCALLNVCYFGLLASWSMRLGSRIHTWDPASKLRLLYHYC
jgi:hypothetical protein